MRLTVLLKNLHDWCLIVRVKYDLLMLLKKVFNIMIIVTRKIKQIQYLGRICRYFNSSVDEIRYGFPAKSRCQTTCSITGNALNVGPQTTVCLHEFRQHFRRPTAVLIVDHEIVPFSRFYCEDGWYAIQRRAGYQRAEKRTKMGGLYTLTQQRVHLQSCFSGGGWCWYYGWDVYFKESATMSFANVFDGL